MKRARAIYFIAANAAILLLTIELAAHVGIVAYRASKPQRTYASLPEPVQRNYAHMTPSDVDELWRDTLASRWRYEPIVGFVAEQQHSRYLNVNEHGVRSNGGAFNQIEGAVWFLGGSTTFGYGVADNETIPAVLQSLIGRPVVNLGVPAHYTLHENKLLARYLRLGFRPSMVVFLDGVNESCEADLAEDELGELVALSQRGYYWQPSRPVVYAGRILLTKAMQSLGMVGRDPSLELDLSCHSAGRDLPLADVHARALVERDAMCDLYQIDCRTYIQPFAGLHGRHDEPGYGDSSSAEYLRELYFHLEPVWKRSNVTFVTSALDGLNHHAYIDDAHYSAESHKLIAGAIAATLRLPTTTDGSTVRPQ